MSNVDIVSVSATNSSRRRRPIVRSRLFRIALLAGALGSMGFWLVSKSQERSLARASEPAAAVSLREMLEKLEAACSQPQFQETIRDFCSRQAEYAKQLPDCAKACRQVASLTPAKATALF